MEERQILESWKEISGFLKRSIKTCQRWESELGLPIHRLDGTPSARVFAYTDELRRWLTEKINHTEAEDRESALTRRHKEKRTLRAAAAALVLAAGAALVWRFLPRQTVSFPLRGLPRLVFLPFENVTGEPTLEPWRTALPQLFTIDLLQSNIVAVESSALKHQILKEFGLLGAQKFTAQELKRIGEKIGGDYIGTGNLIKSGRDMIVDLSLHDSKTGEQIQSFRTICRGERAIFPGVDELTRKLKHGLNLPGRLIAQDVDEDVGRIVTDAMGALKLYCQGIQLNMEGKTREAIPLFRQATEADPEFAEAFYQLFWAHRALFALTRESGARDDAVRYGKKAFECSDRLNSWTRGLLIEQYYLRFQKNLAMAIAEYKKLLAIRADDPVVMLQLAQIYSDLEEPDKIIALLENENAKQDSRNVRLLATAHMRKGAFADAEKILDDYLGKNPSMNASLLYEREICALSQNKLEEASAYNDRLLSQKKIISVQRGRAPIFIAGDDFPNAEGELRKVIEQGAMPEKAEAILNLAGLYLTQGKLQEARNQAGLVLESVQSLPDWTYKKRAHSLMAHLDRLCGDLPEALREAEQSCPCYEEDDLFVDEKSKRRIAREIDDIYCLRYFHLRALINLEIGRIEEFDRRAAEIKQLIDRGQRPKLIRAYYHLLGQRELRESNFDKAIEYFWKSLNQLPSPVGHPADIDSAQYYYSLAEAYDRAGKCRRALDLYRKVPASWEQRTNSGDLYARSFYRIAKIYDQCPREAGAAEKLLKSDKALAIENYRKFLSLWKDADPLFAAEVEDAKKRLSALEAE